jgi:hypothetical protein
MVKIFIQVIYLINENIYQGNKSMEINLINFINFINFIHLLFLYFLDFFYFCD